MVRWWIACLWLGRAVVAEAVGNGTNSSGHRLLLGVVLKRAERLLRMIAFPVTAILLVFGIVIGISLRNTTNDNDIAESSAKMLSSMDPHLLLYTFLPPLLFESSYKMEFHELWEAKSYILLLAGPGLLVSTFMSGVLINGILTLGSDHNICHQKVTGHLLGVILSATDPVAVVASLKELGAKKSLATSIEGESLLNDGTAYVLFLILFDISQNGGGDEEPIYYFWQIVKGGVGGALWGLICGIAMKWSLSQLVNDATSEVTVTFGFAYLTFFVGEAYLHVSGVLACVFLGFHFGHLGNTAVSPIVMHVLDEFWEMMAFMGNTLVFVIAGLIMGHQITAKFYQLPQLLLIYASVTVIRTLVVFVVYGWLRLLGKPLDWKDQVIGIWGGLRGAVGLALAMLVHGGTVNMSSTCDAVDKSEKYVGDSVLFHTAGIVVLTVVFNATTLPKVMSRLGMTDQLTDIERMVRARSIEWFQHHADMHVDGLKLDPMTKSVQWEDVTQYFTRKEQDTSPLYKQVLATSMSPEAMDELTEKELRTRVLSVCRIHYVEANRGGQLPLSAFVKLLKVTDKMLANSDCPLDEWPKLHKHLEVSDALKRGSSANRTLKLRRGQPGYKRQQMLEFLDSPKAVAFIILIVCASTYINFTSSGLSSSTISTLDYLFTAVFVVEVSIRAYCINSAARFTADTNAMIDLAVTVIDVVFLMLQELYDTSGSGGDIAMLVRFFRFIRVIRILRMYRVFKMVSANHEKHRSARSAQAMLELSTPAEMNRTASGTNVRNSVIKRVNTRDLLIEEGWDSVLSLKLPLSWIDRAISLVMSLPARMSQRALDNDIKLEVSLLVGFIQGRQVAKKAILETLAEIVGIEGHNELRMCKTLNRVEQDLELAHKLLVRYTNTHFDIVQTIVSTFVAHEVLNHQLELLVEFEHHGIMSPEEVETIRKTINEDALQLRMSPPKLKFKTEYDIFATSPLMSSVPSSLRGLLEQEFITHREEKGTQLVVPSDVEELGVFYFIGRGNLACTMTSGKQSEGADYYLQTELGIGSTIYSGATGALMHLMTNTGTLLFAFTLESLIKLEQPKLMHSMAWEVTKSILHVMLDKFGFNNKAMVGEGERAFKKDDLVRVVGKHRERREGKGQVGKVLNPNWAGRVKVELTEGILFDDPLKNVRSFVPEVLKLCPVDQTKHWTTFINKGTESLLVEFQTSLGSYDVIHIWGLARYVEQNEQDAEQEDDADGGGLAVRTSARVRTLLPLKPPGQSMQLFTRALDDNRPPLAEDQGAQTCLVEFEPGACWVCRLDALVNPQFVADYEVPKHAGKPKARKPLSQTQLQQQKQRQKQFRSQADGTASEMQKAHGNSSEIDRATVDLEGFGDDFFPNSTSSTSRGSGGSNGNRPTSFEIR